jgi:S-adenosylmethionine synthetase
MTQYILTSESVSCGHPDKVADCISDAVLDLYLFDDENAKVACETMVKNNDVYVCGEITSIANITPQQIEDCVRGTINDIGYDSNELHFNGDTVKVHLNISAQSREINNAVVGGDELTAGDQGIMFGYATRETPNNMPLPIYLSKQFIETAWQNRNKLNLRPDMKSQVSVKFHNGKAIEVDNVVLSMCHHESYTIDSLREMFYDSLKPSVLSDLPDSILHLFTGNTKWYINPAGTWNIGGPVSDCGLTGRKIVVDQYGADCEIGGGAFSGKDPSKVDRSAAYMARHIALKTLQHFEESNKIKVQLSYAIGQKYPVSLRIWDPTTGIEYPLTGFDLEDLTPNSIIDILKLKNPIYLNTARRGHFGVDPFYYDGVDYHEWEKI